MSEKKDYGVYSPEVESDLSENYTSSSGRQATGAVDPIPTARKEDSMVSAEYPNKAGSRQGATVSASIESSSGVDPIPTVPAQERYDPVTRTDAALLTLERENLALRAQLEEARKALDNAWSVYQSEIKGLEAAHTALCAATSGLVEKIDQMLADPQLKAVFAMAHIHGYNYTGTQIQEELETARQALALHGGKET